MGIVYEAEQISLARRVALKVLAFAAALDAKQLQRFKTEAQAAAQLHHTNIVPVYGVGSDRGVHYYAMQFIDGQTLAALIQDLKRLAGPEPGDQIANCKLANPPSEASRVAVAPAAETVRQSATVPHSTRNPTYFRTMATLAVQAPRRWSTPTAWVSYTATSSRPTCWSTERETFG
jgi:eukaryotic-like serine/threonine-protein kinase